MRYLRHLDKSLAPVYRILNDAKERGKQVSTMMTADHGLMSIKRSVNIMPLIHQQLDRHFEQRGKQRYKYRPKSTVMNQSRLISIHLPARITPDELSSFEKFSDSLARDSTVELVAGRIGTTVRIESRHFSVNLEYDFTDQTSCKRAPYRLRVTVYPKDRDTYSDFQTSFLCAEELDRIGLDTFPPYFISKLATYFNSVHYPDILVLAFDGVRFDALTKS